MQNQTIITCIQKLCATQYLCNNSCREVEDVILRAMMNQNPLEKRTLEQPKMKWEDTF